VLPHRREQRVDVGTCGWARRVEPGNVSLLSPIGATLGAQQREVVIIRDDD